jgi:hypothetical protein
MATNRAFRVYRMSEATRKSLKTTREKHNVTTKAVLDGAVSDKLPRIVAALKAVGLGPLPAKVRPARLPVDDELLGALKVASAQTGVPASRLLIASLTLFCGVKKGGRKS